MKYTLKDIKSKIEAIKEFQFCRVDVDGKCIGTAVVDDLLDVMYRFYYTDENRTISKIIIGGKEYPIKWQLAFLPLNGEEVFDAALRQGRLPRPVRPNICPDEDSKNPSAMAPRPKSDRDLCNAIPTERSKPIIVPKAKPQEKTKTKYDGGTSIFGKLKAWVKGDKGYRK